MMNDEWLKCRLNFHFEWWGMQGAQIIFDTGPSNELRHKHKEEGWCNGAVSQLFVCPIKKISKSPYRAKLRLLFLLINASLLAFKCPCMCPSLKAFLNSLLNSLLSLELPLEGPPWRPSRQIKNWTLIFDLNINIEDLILSIFWPVCLHSVTQSEIVSYVSLYHDVRPSYS